YLCEINLKDYITNLPHDFMNYEIQRGIVPNKYLDNLINTVLTQSHIPPLTLVVEEVQVLKDNKIEIRKFKILDGLQRTYRLKVIWDTIELFIRLLKTEQDIEKYTQYKLSRLFGEELSKINSSPFVLSKISKYVNEHKGIDLITLIEQNNQWFEIWGNLSPRDEVEKMLILNAGHKTVQPKLQLELLFLNLIPHLEKHKWINDVQFKLMREREVPSAQFSKRRAVGEFHFSHLIAAILSLIEGNTITTNTSLINELQKSSFDVLDYFEYDFFESFITFLLSLDVKLRDCYGEDGTQWISRETVIVGIFGSMGRFIKESNLDYSSAFKVYEDKLLSDVRHLNILEYNKVRSRLNLSKVNIGNVAKKAVYEGIYEFIKNADLSPVNWENFFKGVQR
ncbi:hypothetical protein, partial [Neobacillus drentensis]|uniref:hypothetical protein n=1 Tax=Neobacillus drentensis TaxID=220684 RepID=UPI002FFE1166